MSGQSEIRNLRSEAPGSLSAPPPVGQEGPAGARPVEPARPRPTDAWRWIAPAPFFARMMPRAAAIMMGRIGGALAWGLAPPARRVLAANLRALGLPAHPAATRRIVQNFGTMLADYGYLWHPRSLRLQDWVGPGGLAGTEHLRAAVAAGRGILMVSPHVGNWELGAALMARMGYRVAILAFPSQDPHMNRFREEARARLGIRTLYVGPDAAGIPGLPALRHLQSGGIVAVLGDLPATPESTIWASTARGPFPIARGPLVLARVSGAPLLPVRLVRDGLHYAATAQPPVFVDAEADRDVALRESAQRLAGSLLETIERHPDQWYYFRPFGPHAEVRS